MMDSTNIYYKIKHDFANQLQLIDIYTRLDKHEARDRLIQSLVSAFKAEQQFLKLPLAQTIEVYITHRVSYELLDYDFEIDMLSSAIGSYDKHVAEIFSRVFEDIKSRIETKSLLTISMFETNSSFELLFVLTGDIINQSAAENVTEMSESLIEYKYEIKRGV